jgi:hypothetical protein
MERKKSVKNYDFHPLVAYVKNYLQKEKPGPGASKIRKDRHAVALKCVKEMDKCLKNKNVTIAQVMLLPPGCGGSWPLKPPIGLAQKIMQPPPGCGGSWPLKPPPGA